MRLAHVLDLNVGRGPPGPQLSPGRVRAASTVGKVPVITKRS